MDCENVFKQEMLVSKGRGTKLEEWMDVTETEEVLYFILNLRIEQDNLFFFFMAAYRLLTLITTVFPLQAD